MSDPTLSVIDFKNKMAGIWTTLNISCQLVHQGSTDDRWVHTDKFSSDSSLYDKAQLFILDGHEKYAKINCQKRTEIIIERQKFRNSSRL